MGIRAAVDGQLAEPHGFSGGLAGLAMLHRPSNRARARWVLSLLEVQPNDRVLDVGIGPGYSTGLIAQALGQGVVVGVDRSALMMAMTKWRLRHYMKARTVTLVHADAIDLPNFNVKFDKVVAIDAVQFQDNALPLLSRLHARMAAGGRIAVAVQPRDSKSASAQALAVEIAEALHAAGFDRPQTYLNASLRRTPCICIIARA
jgi:cyclopropane fatty-acyl-phospholipid synthase-like methyltransferase